jgi:polyferredoxin
MFLDTLLGSGIVVVAIVLSFVPLIESLRSQGVRVPERLIRNLAGIGKIFLFFAVYTSVVLFLEYYVTADPFAHLYPFLDAASLGIFLYMIYRIVQLFSSLTTKKAT